MKIKINISTFILLFLASITGLYKEFLIIFIIIIVHEMGHFLAGYIYKWNFDKIEIFPFGGCVKFNESLNKSINEELIILLSGPLIQVLLFLFVSIIYKNGFISYRNYNLFKMYHYMLLIFNLLPIYPLDGGRIVNLFLYKVMPYKLSNKIMILISLVTIIISCFIYKNINYIFMAIMIIFDLLKYLKEQEYLFNKLLLERLMYKYSFKKIKVIKNINRFYKERKHFIKVNDHYIDENEYLSMRYGG